jgi:hypothetical protein
MNEAAESTISILKKSIAPSNIGDILTRATFIGNNPPSHGLMGWILYLIASVILGVTRIFVWALSFTTITIPTLIFKILSVSFTLTLNFSSL